MNGEHYVYRVYDQYGCCLYVGRTVDPIKRWETHCKKQVWSGEACEVAVYGPYSLAEAAQIEAETIRDLWPAHNHALNPLLLVGKRVELAEAARQQVEVRELRSRGVGLVEAWAVVDFRRLENICAQVLDTDM